MKRKFFGSLTISILVLIILPWMTNQYAESDEVIPIFQLLFYVINPLYFVVLGFFLGKNILKLWSIPNISALQFLLGTWLFYENYESNAFVIYSEIYMMISLFFMFATVYIRRLLIKHKHGTEDRFQIIYNEI